MSSGRRNRCHFLSQSLRLSRSHSKCVWIAFPMSAFPMKFGFMSVQCSSMSYTQLDATRTRRIYSPFVRRYSTQQATNRCLHYVHINCSSGFFSVRGIAAYRFQSLDFIFIFSLLRLNRKDGPTNAQRTQQAYNERNLLIVESNTFKLSSLEFRFPSI